MTAFLILFSFFHLLFSPPPTPPPFCPTLFGLLRQSFTMNAGWPLTHDVDQADLSLTVVLLSCLTGMHHQGLLVAVFLYKLW